MWGDLSNLEYKNEILRQEVFDPDDLTAGLGSLSAHPVGGNAMIGPAGTADRVRFDKHDGAAGF